MDTLQLFVGSGRIAEIVLITLALESIAVVAVGPRFGLRRAEWLWLLGSGLGLVAALRSALQSGSAGFIAGMLLFALVCHCGHLYCRFRPVDGSE